MRNWKRSISSLKKHPKTASETVVYVDLISALKAAIKTSDPDAIEHEMTALVNALGSDKDYKIYQAEQGEEQKKQDALELGDVIRRGKQERDFIVDYIGKNATADVSADLNAYYKQLNPALQQPILNELKPLVNKVEVAIREAKLEDAFNAWRERSLDTNGPENPPVTDLPLTGKNWFLVEGALDDVEILYNASQNAPHVAENLRGEFVFAQSQARVCLFGQNPSELALIVKQEISAMTDPRQIAVVVEPCNPEQLLSYDIVATQRNAFLRSKKEDALALIKHIEENNYRKFAEVTAADLNKAADAERAKIENIKANVADGAPDGFGIRAPEEWIADPMPGGWSQGSESPPVAGSRRGQTQPRNADRGRNHGHDHRRCVHQSPEGPMRGRLRLDRRFEGADYRPCAQQCSLRFFQLMEFADRC